MEKGFWVLYLKRTSQHWFRLLNNKALELFAKVRFPMCLREKSTFKECNQNPRLAMKEMPHFPYDYTFKFLIWICIISLGEKKNPIFYDHIWYWYQIVIYQKKISLWFCISLYDLKWVFLWLQVYQQAVVYATSSPRWISNRMSRNTKWVHWSGGQRQGVLGTQVKGYCHSSDTQVSSCCCGLGIICGLDIQSRRVCFYINPLPDDKF